MSYLPVIDTHIVSVQNLFPIQGRTLQMIEIASPGFDSQPGQFVMIQKQDEGFAWSYPYMVFENTSNGLKVLASSQSSLWNIKAGASIALWGANGKACDLKGNEIFVAEASTLHLILPLVHHTQMPSLILWGKPLKPLSSCLPENTEFMDNGQAILQYLKNADANIYMALNLPVLEQIIPLSENAPAPSSLPELSQRLFIFASTQIGCGIGACKACYLHNPKLRMGIPVCCNGPYIPYTMIDFEKDKKCFQVFL